MHQIGEIYLMLPDAESTPYGPYGRAARLYRAAGWHGVLPLGGRPGLKSPPPGGWTGHDAPDPSGADIEGWIETHGDRNIGLRAPAGVLGLDVDAYVKDGKPKAGAEVLAQLVAECGPLPPTWVSGSRPAPSGIYWFRVPLELDGRPINWPGEAGKGIEIIQHGHRYAVVWPSTNPDAAGAEYRWSFAFEYEGDWPDDMLVPRAESLPALPETWVRRLALSYERTSKASVTQAESATWWGELRGGAPCPRVAASLSAAREELDRGSAGRHEVARDTARTLAAYGGEGHAGTAQALLDLGAAFAAAVGPGRESEWMRLLTGAVELAMTADPRPRQTCTCNPPVLPTVANGGLTLPETFAVPPPSAGTLDAPVDPETLSDGNMAVTIADEYLRGRFIRADGIGWLRWVGTHWQECSDRAAVEAVRAWLVEYVSIKAQNPYLRADRDGFRALLALESAYRIKAITDLAGGILEVAGAALDARPDALNALNGTIELSTGELRPHDPRDLFTKCATVDYVPGAEHADWKTALGAVPEDVADWLQVRFGQASTGHMTSDDRVLVLRGGGENGKSTILNAVKSVLGRYSVLVSDKVLLSQDSGAHTTEVTDLKGARFALLEELPDEGHLNTRRLKAVAGTPEMTARRIRENEMKWQATHSLFISSNFLPKITDTDHGTWRRLALVRFPYKFVKPGEGTGADHEREGDPTLRDRMQEGREQREAVLAWLVAGARRWYDNGRVMHEMPATITADTAAWRADVDIMIRFWMERLEPDPQSYITAGDMHAEFNAWAVEAGHREMSTATFKAKFEQHDMTTTNRVVFHNRRVREGERRSYRPQRLAVPAYGLVVAQGDVDATVGKMQRAWWGVRFIP